MLARIVRFVTENWALKLAAVMLALLLWLAVRANTPKEQPYRNIPVEVDLRDPDWRLEGEPEPPTATVQVVGSNSELLKLVRNPPRIILPVERVNDTTQTHVVPPQWVRFPPGVDAREVRVVRVRPDTVQLDFERLVSRTLPVSVSTSGDLPEGLALQLPIQTSPGAVQVRGPAGVLDQLDSVPLLPVELGGLRSPTNVPTRVDTSALGGAFRFDPREVNVVLRVVPVDSQPGLRQDTTLPDGAPPS